jgi:hypothetical protein
VEHVTVARRLAILARFWWILACLPSQESPRIHAWLAMSWRRWASSWSPCGRPTPPAMAPMIRLRSFVTVASIIRPALVFCFFVLFLVCNILQRLSVIYISILLGMSPLSLTRQGSGSSVGPILSDMPPPGSHTAASRGFDAQLVMWRSRVQGGVSRRLS